LDVVFDHGDKNILPGKMVAFDHLENYNYFSPTSKCGVVFLIESFSLDSKNRTLFQDIVFFFFKL